MSEYNNSAVNGASCSYANLSHYNQGCAKAPAPSANNVCGMYIVPTYSAPGYNTLTHGGAPSCSGYFNIKGAYGANAGSCNTRYVQKLCQ
jgi:hypothetical protein